MIEDAVGTIRPRGRTRAILIVGLVAALAPAAWSQQALGSRMVKGRPLTEFLSSGGLALALGKKVASVPAGTDAPVIESLKPVTDSKNKPVNDPCLDPDPADQFPFNFFDVVQSETSIAVWNGGGSPSQRRLVASYNDSRGFTSNTGGLTGIAFSTNSGQQWIDGGALPPRFPDTGPPPPGNLIFDQYFGDPSVVVDQSTGTFYAAGLYLSPQGWGTLAVSKGRFRNAPPQQTESVSNIGCLFNASLFGVPSPPSPNQVRIIWGNPVVAVRPPFLGPGNADFLDKELLFFDQASGKLYLTYTRFAANGDTPIEMVVSSDGGQTWSPPRVIVPNELDTLNQATMPVVTPNGRVVVAWWARKFDITDPTFPIVDADIEVAFSNNDGLTWSQEIKVGNAEPQGEPSGYNRGRALILNAPSIAVDLGRDDGVHTNAEKSRPGFGNVYVAFTRGSTPLPASTHASNADIFVARSTDGGKTWDRPVLVNDDATATSHVFPTLAVKPNGQVFVAWIDRRRDPVNNNSGDTYAAVSSDLASTFGPNKMVSDVPSNTWFVRADAAPNMGDYIQSAILDGAAGPTFVIVTNDGRFLPPGKATVLRRHTRATPDSWFIEAKNLP